MTTWIQDPIPGLEYLLPEKPCGGMLGHPAHRFRRAGQGLYCPGLGLLAGRPQMP